MNLRVDLILETERRSASVVSGKSLVRVAYIVAPILVVLIVAWIVVATISLGRELSDLQERWKTDEPKKEKAALLRKQLGVNKDIDKEVAGWGKSRLRWHDLLLEIQKQVPPTIQLRDLKITQNLVITNNAPARVFRMTLQGTAVGNDPEFNKANVQALKVRLEKIPVFYDVMEAGGVRVERFEQPSDKDAQRNNRVFEVSCALKPRKFE